MLKGMTNQALNYQLKEYEVKELVKMTVNY